MSNNSASNNNEQEYISRILARAQDLIRNGVWEGIQKDRLDNWLGALNNFQAGLLAAYILDSLCYRSKGQYWALLDCMLEDLFVNIPATRKLPARQMSFKETFKSGPLCMHHGLVVAPVIGSSQPPTKSGPYILRLIEKKFRLDKNVMSWPHKLSLCEKLTHVFFVDDFCGTGDQFVEFLEDIDFSSLCQKFEGLQVTYLVTVIHQKGLEKIKTQFPQINIRYAEFLPLEDADIFSDKSIGRYAVPNFAQTIRDQYEAVISKGGYGRNVEKYGYGQLGLTYGFAHGTPNNSLPILWMHGDNIPPLMDR